MNLYKPTEMEAWITDIYRSNSILSPADMDIDRIGKIFNSYIVYHERAPKVFYEDDEPAMIFLNIHNDIEKQRENFFHELCHPAMHSGDQQGMPRLFIDLQEAQAAQFQLYAAMPAFMLEEFEPSQYFHQYLTMLADAFRLPYSFVKRRIDQIQRRIYREMQDRNMRARTTPRPTIYEYSETTRRILDQLHRQLADRRTKLHAER